ncbi:MAG: hypothetical protein AAFQ82_12805 [Myxococcota bacterium]
MRGVAKYLEQYAETEASYVDDVEPHRHCLVIPSCAEGAQTLRVLDGIPEDSLVVVVVNERADVSDEVRRLNRETLSAFDRAFESEQGDSGLRVSTTSFGHCVVVDRTASRSLPAEQGVGLARKIGADVALACAARSDGRCQAIAFTDADARLPENFFDAVASVDWRVTAAAWHRFVHYEDADAPADLIWAYDIWLRYAVAGLRHAGSPYAFHTVGSTQSVSCSAYAAVRGVPKRLAAEDFYFFNKLAKVGPIRPIGTSPIRLSGRCSSRVPFGTGAAMSQWDGERSVEDFRLYDPRVYEVLAKLLSELDVWCSSGGSLDEQLAIALGPFRQTLDVFRIVERCESARAQVRSSESLKRRLASMFDGFWTLKVIHALRDAHFPNVPLRQALAEASFLRVDAPESAPLRSLCEAVIHEEQGLKGARLRASLEP